MKKAILFSLLAVVFLVFGFNYKNRDVDLTAGIISITLEIIGSILLFMGLRGFFKFLFPKKPLGKFSEEDRKLSWKDYLWLVLSTLFLFIGLSFMYLAVQSGGLGDQIPFAIGLLVSLIFGPALIGTIGTISAKKKKNG